MNGCADCGGGECGPAGCAGGYADSGSLMDRLKDYILPSDGCGGRYRSVFGGWSDADDFNGTAFSGSVNDGFLLGTARGRYLSENLRVEWENNWRNNSGDTFSTPAAGTNPLGGQFNMFSTMFNTVKEFGCGRIQPYVGGGIGLGIQDGDFSDGAGTTIRLDDWRFAYQGIVGMNLKSTDRTDVYFEYRYYGNTESQIEINGVEVDSFIFNSENIVFGFRFKR
jgi:opacity protein-like surface antigen